MNQPVQNAAFGIKPGHDFVEISGVLMLISAPNGPGDKIGNLDDSRSLRIDEQRHFRQIAELSPSSPANAKRPGKALERALMTRLVHDDETSMLAFLLSSRSMIDAVQLKIEAVAYLLKSVFNRVVRSTMRFMNRNREQFNVAGPDDFESIFDNLKTTYFTSNPFPRLFPSSRDSTGVKLYIFIFRKVEAQGLYEFIHAL